MTTNHILASATDRELALAVFGNLYDLFRAMAVFLGGEIFESGGLSRHISFPSNPMFKGVWAARLSPGE